jgi:uncharacterized protein (DUF433 family)
MTTTLNGYVETTPGVRSGKPRMKGRRITVSDIVVLHLRMGEPIAIVAHEYDLTLAEVHAALSYYYDHKAEVDQSILDSEAFAEEFRHQSESPLQRKLQQLKLHHG